jgi:tripartite-type tricarboxylate transporter receptor subunit TctC
MIALLWAGTCATAHAAVADADFYRGRTLTIIVGYTAGGGYDLYARLLAQHFGSHLPGHPNVIPQNMPGAGSLKAANYLYSIAPKDGSVIGIFAHGMGSAPLLGEAQFDARKFAWIGSMTKDVMICVSWKDSPISSWADLGRRQFLAGGVAAGNAPDIYAKLFRSVFGINIRLATGFPGTAGISLGMQRHEVDGMCGIAWSTLKGEHGDWLRDKSVHVLLQIADQKQPELAAVPSALDMAREPWQRAVLKFVIASQTMARPFTAPPGIPAGRKAILRTAFAETMRDPAFLADARKLQLDIAPVSGDEIDAVIASLYATPKDVIARTKSILN